MHSDEVIHLLQSIGAVQVRSHPPFRLSSGGTSPIYIDNRRIVSFPWARDRIVELLVDVTEMVTFDYISATAMAGIPFGTLMADRLHLPMVYVRPVKEHGLKNTVEGYLAPGSHVLIVEDHVTTGNSVIANAEAIRASGGYVSDCVCITSYVETLSSLALHRLTTVQTILDLTGVGRER